VRGVKAVNPKGSAGKAAKLEVEFEGSSFDLADRLLTSGLSIQAQDRRRETERARCVSEVRYNQAA
jgi:hypothetical protein